MKSNWQTKKLKEVSTKPQYGWTTKADKPGLNKVKLLRTTDITKKIVDWETVPTCTDEPSDISKYLLNEGDILISRAGSVGVSYLVQKEPPYKTVFASYLIRFRPTTNPKYLKYYLDSPEYWNFITEKSSGIALKNVNASKLANLPVPIPEEDTQDKIVQTLDTLFSKIDAGEESLRQVEKMLEVYRQAVLRNAFDKYDQYKIISDIAYVGTGATPKRGNPKYWKGGNIPWVTSSVVNKTKVLDASEYVTKEALSQTNIKIFPIGTILMAMYGEGKTRGKVTELGIDAATNQALAAIILKDEFIHYRDFLKLYLLKNYEDIRAKSSGGVQPNLNLSIVKNTLIPIPDYRKAKETVQALNVVLSNIEVLRNSIIRNKEVGVHVRQSILKKAFSGELTN